ncbi:putative baseplate assembly protein [Cohnella cholangitidis]|uniref:Putative baseplate assembly protein n=1 Tax=Cohnella cholangitidis TaxID=2598458 RepID=A0A7G5BVW5_9BACL|nr:putative baseplate assembly protein [Cohnella cholangitidis]QMV41099.1 putative baseplate assembly protein [Cohnella cholangitidis]
MLPRIPLDDRTFDSILQEARRGIPQRLPEWTDENTHDPGVTFLELFAWLSEMQQFYLSRVPERNLRKFLDLLGVIPRESESAETEVSFGNVHEPVVLPKGTKLRAEDQLFETVASVKLLPIAIDRIVTRTESEASDRSASNTGGNVAFYAFGREAEAGSRLYIAFDREPMVGETISMHIRLAEDGNETQWVSGKPEGVVPSARVAWKIYGWTEEHGASWLPLELLEDETLHLTYSGRISFRVTDPARAVIVHPAGDRPRYWINCTVEESGYELPPRIDQVLLNTVKARQQDTKSEQTVYDGTGLPGLLLLEDSYLARYGKMRVQVREPDGRWREWKETNDFSTANANSHVYAVEREFGLNGPVAVRFGDGVQGAIPPLGSGNIRRIHYAEDFLAHCWIGRSNGLPNQRFQLFDLPCKWKDRLLLQVGVREAASGELLWEDWEPVDDFDRSGPLDRHYVYDSGTNQLTFGNDENGAIPSQHEDANLCLTVCVLGGGERGNIKPHLLTEWIQPELGALNLTADNAGYGVGGREEETLEQTLERAQQEWQNPYCAVTAEDYVRIAKSTPGLKVSRVHVIPDYAPGRENAPGAVTVVVVPEGLNDTPLPSAGFLATVAKHLDDRRLITTEVHVVAPEYIQVTVHAVVVVEPHFMEEAHRIVAALNRLLSPMDKPGGIQGWPFGRTVHKGDIYSAISRIKGVAYVQDLWLDAEGRSLRKSAGGDIVLPDAGIVYSGEHRIELISRTQL